MNFKVETATLKKAIPLVQAGMGGGKVLPITAYIHLELVGNSLKITSTTLNTYLTAVVEVEGIEDGEVVIAGEQFIKLVSKTSKKEMTFELVGTDVMIRGNGSYELPILQEIYPSYEFGNVVEEGEFDVKALQSVVSLNKSSIATDMTMPCLTGFRLGEKAITTNAVKMCINNTELMKVSMLIPPELATLMTLFTSEKVQYKAGDERLLLSNEKLTVFGSALEGIEDYPDIEPILESEFNAIVRLRTSEVIEVLERLGIFADMLNVEGVSFTFTDDHMMVTDQKGKNEEEIMYVESKDNSILEDGAEVEVNLAYMLDILRVIETETFELYYGNDDMIKLTSGTVTYMMAQLGDD